MSTIILSDKVPNRIDRFHSTIGTLSSTSNPPVCGGVQVRNKRAYIAELIRNLAAAQNPGKELKFLELQFQADSSSNGGGMGGEDDMEDDEVEDLEEGQAAPLSRHVKVKKVYFLQCCGTGSGIRCYFWPQDRRSRSGMNISDHFS